jgi:hypothetical protein
MRGHRPAGYLDRSGEAVSPPPLVPADASVSNAITQLPSTNRASVGRHCDGALRGVSRGQSDSAGLQAGCPGGRRIGRARSSEPHDSYQLRAATWARDELVAETVRKRKPRRVCLGLLSCLLLRGSSTDVLARARPEPLRCSSVVETAAGRSKDHAWLGGRCVGRKASPKRHARRASLRAVAWHVVRAAESEARQ